MLQLRCLILHERNEGRNHDRRLTQHNRWQLVAERLASSSRHDGAGVLLVEQALDDVFLKWKEVVVSPILLQDLSQMARIVH